MVSNIKIKSIDARIHPSGEISLNQIENNFMNQVEEKVLLAFHSYPAIKKKYLARVKAHAEADAIVKGQYWDEGKGCAVGCTIEGNDHSRYEYELGIPATIAYLEDTIFEGLPNKEAMKFPEKFLKAIPVGADLSLVAAKFMVWQFEDEKFGLKNIDEIKSDAEVMEVCADVVALYKRVIDGGTVSEKEWLALYDRADKIYYAGAWAWAWAGAWAAENEMYSVMAEKLLELSSDAPVKK